MKQSRNTISDWLEKHGDPKIKEQVEKEAKEILTQNKIEMKTPMQEFIDEVSKCRNEMLEFASKMDKREGFFEGMIKAFGDVESILKFRYLEKEKNAIIDAYFEGARGWFEECRGDVADYDKEEAEKYYNDTFTK